MKMRKYILILCVLIIFFTSCTTTDEKPESNWRTGTEGILMNFMPDNPPSEVLSTQELSVILEYKNKGAYDVSNLKFYLTGFDPSIFSFSSSPETSNIAIDGKNEFFPEGSQVTHTWKASINPPSDVDSFKQDLTVTACYNYETKAIANICIDPNRYEQVVSTRCNYDIEGLGSSQGGPIAVTSVKQKTTNNKIYLEIYFENKGGGIPFSRAGGIERCHSNLEITDADTLRVNGVYLRDGVRFSCKPDDRIRLTNGKGFIVCERSMPSGEIAYYTTLTIDLVYSYRQAISKTVTVVNVD